MENIQVTHPSEAASINSSHVNQSSAAIKTKTNLIMPILLTGLVSVIAFGIRGYYLGHQSVSVQTTVPRGQDETSFPTSSLKLQLTPQVTLEPTIEQQWPKRQFIVSDKFFENKQYPNEVIAIPDSNLVEMNCSKDYFSWNSKDYSYTDPKTNETTKLSDVKLTEYLSKIISANENGNITSISYCKIADGRVIVGYRLGPCGGGCAGIQNFSYADSNGNLSFIAKVQPPEEGAYYSCTPIELTKENILYLKCSGEGTASVQKLDLTTNTYTPIIRCKYTSYGESNSAVECK